MSDSLSSANPTAEIADDAAIILQNGDIMSCLTKTLHHLTPNKAGIVYAMVTRHGELDTINFEFHRATRRITAAIEHLKRIRAAADKAGCKEVLDALYEEFDY